MSGCKTYNPTCADADSCPPKKMASLQLEVYNACRKYQKGDPAVLYQGHIAQAVTDQPNADDPLVGALKDPATWVITPLSDLAGRTQPGRDGTDGANGANGADGRDGVDACGGVTIGHFHPDTEGAQTFFDQEAVCWGCGISRSKQGGHSVIPQLDANGKVIASAYWSECYSYGDILGIALQTKEVTQNLADTPQATLVQDPDNPKLFTYTYPDGTQVQFTLGDPNDDFVETNTTLLRDPDGDGSVFLYEHTDINGDKHRFRTLDGLPSGVHTVESNFGVTNGVGGSLKDFAFSGAAPHYSVNGNSAYATVSVDITFSVAAHPGLLKVGVPLGLSFTGVSTFQQPDITNGDKNLQWGITILDKNGVRLDKKPNGNDRNKHIVPKGTQDWMNMTDICTIDVVSDGADLKYTVVFEFWVNGTATANHNIKMDGSSATMTIVPQF